MAPYESSKLDELRIPLLKVIYEGSPRAVADTRLRMLHKFVSSLPEHRCLPSTGTSPSRRIFYGPEIASELGTALPFTTSPSMEAGSTKRRLKSGSSRGHDWGNRRIPDLKTLPRGARAWNRQMNP